VARHPARGLVRSWAGSPRSGARPCFAEDPEPIDKATAFGCIVLVKDTYSIRELQRDTAGAVREAEAGVLVTVTRNDHPVAHVISAERLGALLETMELTADPAFARELRKLLSRNQKFHPVSALAD